MATHPYRRRTELRRNLPWILIGLLPKDKDCEGAGGIHQWYNHDGKSSACYHCKVIRPGQLWPVEEAAR
jgi:hypothetical protein